MKPSGKITGLFIVFLFAAFFYHWYRGLESEIPDVRSMGKPSLEGLKWLSGYWISDTDGEQTEEIWSSPAGGVMQGLHRTVRSDGGTFLEYLLIEERPDGLFYIVQPGNNPQVVFTFKEWSKGSVVFENPAHDYPKIISYRREGKKLHARIEGADPVSDAREWTWERTDFDR